MKSKIHTYSKKNKNNLSTTLILVFVLVISFSAFAQHGGKINKRIKAQKTAFITEKLNLSADEAAKFWPIYNDIESKKNALREKSSLKRKAKKPDELTEKEAKALLSEMLDIEDQKHQLHRALVSKLENVISSKKIMKLMRAEREFDRNLLKRLREMRENRRAKKD